MWILNVILIITAIVIFAKYFNSIGDVTLNGLGLVLYILFYTGGGVIAGPIFWVFLGGFIVIIFTIAGAPQQVISSIMSPQVFLCTSILGGILGFFVSFSEWRKSQL